MDKLSKNKPLIVAVSVVVILIIISIFISRSNLEKSAQQMTPTQQAEQVQQEKEAAFKVNLNETNFNAAVSPESTKGITATEKRAVYESLLSGFKVMTSGDAKAIRAYMLAKAQTPAEKNFVTTMTDANLSSLSARLSQTMVMPVPELLLASTSVWKKDGSSITIQYNDPNTGTTTKKVVNIDGKWY